MKNVTIRVEVAGLADYVKWIVQIDIIHVKGEVADMKIEDYAVEYAVKKSTNKAFWWNKFDEPKDKREVQKILWKNPVMLLTIISTAMLVFIFCFLVILNGDRLEYYILVAIIEIVFLIPLGLSTRYIITKHYFEEKFERS